MAQFQNLFKNSNDFTNGSFWSNTSNSLTLVANSTDILDPFGGNASTKITTNGAGTSQRLQATNTHASAVVQAGELWTISVYIYPVTSTTMSLRHSSAGGLSQFNDMTGLTLNVWQRVSFTFTANVGVTAGVNEFIYPCGTGADTDNTAGKVCYLYGAQLTKGNNPGPYIATTSVAYDVGPLRNRVIQAQNLILQSQTFDNASWTKTRVTVPASFVLAPDGTTTAETMTDTSAGANTYNVSQTLTLTNGQQETFSAYLKAGTRSWVWLSVDSGTGGVYFNVSTGAIGTITTGYTAYIETAANGFFRCVVTGTYASATPLCRIYIASGDGGVVYTGDGTGTIIMWGAQTVKANWAGPYVVTTTAAVNTGALRNRGIQAQNLILQSSDQSNASWTKGTGVTATGNTSDVTDPNGGNTACKLVYDGSSDTAHSRLAQTNANFIGPFSSLTTGLWLRVSSGTRSMLFYDGTNFSTSFTVTTSWQLITFTEPVTAGSNIRIWLYDNANTGFTIYTAFAQMALANRLGPYVATTSTVVNMGGIRNAVIQGQNFLTFSQQFSNAAHVPTNITFTDNQATAPDGTMTASLGTSSVDGGVVAHGTRHFSGTTTVGVPIIISCYFKAGTKGTPYITANSSGFSAIFDVTNGVLGTISNSVNGETAGMEPAIWNGVVQTGWYRCWLGMPWGGNPGAGVGIASNTTTINFQGAGTETIYAWGMQFEKINPNHPGPYTPTVATAVNNGAPRNRIVQGQNLFLQSETFDNGSWAKTTSSVTANATTAPDGTVTADKLVEDSSNAPHYINQAPGGTTANGQTVTISVFAKAAERSYLLIAPNAGTSTHLAYFNLSTGTIGTLGTAVLGYKISPALNGFYRCSVTVPYVTATPTMRLQVASADATPSYQGDGASGIYLWGANMTHGTNPGQYDASTKTTTAVYNIGDLRNAI